MCAQVEHERRKKLFRERVERQNRKKTANKIKRRKAATAILQIENEQREHFFPNGDILHLKKH